MLRLTLRPGLPRSQTRAQVRQQLNKHNLLGGPLSGTWFPTKQALQRYPAPVFDTLFGQIGRLRDQLAEEEISIDRLRIPAPELIDLGRASNLTAVELRSFVEGNTLNLLSLADNNTNGKDRLRELIDIFQDAETAFRQLSQTATGRTSDVFRLITQTVRRLHFKNVQIYIPREGSRWERAYTSSQWATDGQSKYAPEQGGAVPSTTLASVIQGHESFYYVDLEDQASFTDQGLETDPASIANDLQLSRGPSQMLFLKVISPETGKLVAVVQIHNRVQLTQEETFEPPLPQNQVESARMIFILQHIFRVATPILEAMQPASVARNTDQLPALEMEEFVPDAEQRLWNWVHGKGGRTLEAKISGAITDAHRQDFISSILPPLREALVSDEVVIWEDAAGATSIIELILRELMEEPTTGGAAVLPPAVLARFHGIARDFSDNAVSQATKAIGEAGFHQIVTVEAGDMFERSDREDKSVDFTVACMAFYCTRERFRSALREWARISNPGARGWFSIKAKDGDMDETKRATIRAFMGAIPLWQKIAFPIFVGRMVSLIIQRKRSGAFEYGRTLRDGFLSGKYYAPTLESLESDLAEAGLQLVSTQRSLANVFFLAEWVKPE